jgi:membrane associated rhomboid family serine protease
MNYMGAITNIPRIAVWFLQPLAFWDSPAKWDILETVTLFYPADLLCVSEQYPLFPTIFYRTLTDPKRHGAFYNHSRM